MLPHGAPISPLDTMGVVWELYGRLTTCKLPSYSRLLRRFQLYHVASCPAQPWTRAVQNLPVLRMITTVRILMTSFVTLYRGQIARVSPGRVWKGNRPASQRLIPEPRPRGSKNAYVRYLPKPSVADLNTEAVHTVYLGTLDPWGSVTPS